MWEEEVRVLMRNEVVLGFVEEKRRKCVVVNWVEERLRRELGVGM